MGRPKKDIIKPKSEINKDYYNNHKFYCEVCNQFYAVQLKKRHLNTNKHKSNSDSDSSENSDYWLSGWGQD